MPIRSFLYDGNFTPISASDNLSLVEVATSISTVSVGCMWANLEKFANYKHLQL